jgi:hypothetical protein
MLEGVHLTLLMGPGVPLPVPRPVIEALESVQVTAGSDRGGFQVSFAASRSSDLTRTMLPAGYFDPGIRVIVIVTLGGAPNVIADGIITRQEVAASNEAGGSKLTVTGEDLSVLMDIVPLPELRYPAMPMVARINLILAKYLAFGIVPLVMPPLFPDDINPMEKVPTQTGTDLAYIQKLAEAAGYVFYLEPGPVPGANLAYFGPDIRIPDVQPALTVASDASSNVEQMSFSLNGLSKKIVIMNVLDPVTRKITIPVPVPNVSLLRPPLGARPTVPLKVDRPTDEAKYPIGEAILRALAKAGDGSDAVTVSGSLDVLRYGQILLGRRMVGVRGAGLTYDGLYYVKSVTHNIKPGEYKQSFTLSRDGLIAAGNLVPA